MIGPSYTPAPGEVHQVGPNGVAFAWLHGAQVCYVRPTSGGCVPVLDAPISLTRGDPDIVGAGRPTEVLGFAIDEVERVVVTLPDGTTAAGAPVRSFFHLELPAGVPPWGAAKVEAIMADGSTYTERLPASGPPPS